MTLFPHGCFKNPLFSSSSSRVSIFSLFKELLETWSDDCSSGTAERDHRWLLADDLPKKSQGDRYADGTEEWRPGLCFWESLLSGLSVIKSDPSSLDHFLDGSLYPSHCEPPVTWFHLLILPVLHPSAGLWSFHLGSDHFSCLPPPPPASSAHCSQIDCLIMHSNPEPPSAKHRGPCKQGAGENLLYGTKGKKRYNLFVGHALGKT